MIAMRVDTHFVVSPGKVYSLGPGQTISNFEIHLKNKQHRENVAKRQQQQQASG